MPRVGVDSVMSGDEVEDRGSLPSRMGAGLLLLALGLCVYVAFCTPFRDNHPLADAWEHHRAIVALEQQLWQPGNPTYDPQEDRLFVDALRKNLLPQIQLAEIEANMEDRVFAEAVVETALELF